MPLSTNVHFAEVKADGFTDLLLDGAAAMFYNPITDVFENCPDLHG